MSSILVNSISKLHELIKTIDTSPVESQFLFIDLEGTNLSRHGSIAIMQILVPPKRVVYLVDVSTLKEQTFETRGASGVTLKNILESKKLPKVFFDVRNDSDALYSHYGVVLQCIVDVQLLEFVTRRRQGPYLNGLARCISYDCPSDFVDKRKWQDVKDAGSKLFAPEKGGSYEVFHQRPLLPEIINYCAQDVLLLPVLLMHYAALLPSSYLAFQVQSETDKRLALSRSSNYKPNGQHKAIGPSLTRARKERPPLPFPMDLITSSKLIPYCTLDELSDSGSNFGPSEQYQNSPMINIDLEAKQSPSTLSTASLVENLVPLQIERAPTPRAVTRLDTPQNE